MNNTPNDKYLIWKKSIPMSKAAFTFAPKDLRDQWENAHKASALTTFMDGLIVVPEDEPKGMDTFIELMKAPQVILGDRTKIKETCEMHILRYIQSGALQSFAFAAPRAVDASPIKLDPHVWDGARKWSENTIIHESLTFVEVRLLNPYSIEKLLGANLDKVIPASITPGPGRPSVQRDIEEAFHSLLDAGKFDLDASAKSKSQDIRKWLIHFKSDGNYGPDKPKYDAIRRHLKPLVIAEKAKNK